MIISLEGSMGSGKSTMAAALITEDQKKTGRKIISNSFINLPNYQHFDLAYFLQNITGNELEDCILYLDEMYQMVDARSSGTKINKLFSYFIVQTRKRGVDLYLCTHHLDHIDLRERRAVDIRGSCKYTEIEPVCKKCKCVRCKGVGKIEGYKCEVCEGKGATGQYGGIPCDRCLGYGKVGVVRGYFLDRRLRKRYTIEALANKYWHIFNTKERLPMQARILQGIDTTEIS